MSKLKFFFHFRYPLLYTPGPANRFFNMRVFALSLLHGIFTSLALFFVTYWTSIDTVDSHGRTASDLATFGFKIVSALVVSVNAEIALETCHWTLLNFLAIFISLAALFVTSAIYYQLLPYNFLQFFLQFGYGAAFVAMQTSTYWFNILLVATVTLLPVVSFQKFDQNACNNF